MREVAPRALRLLASSPRKKTAKKRMTTRLAELATACDTCAEDAGAERASAADAARSLPVGGGSSSLPRSAHWIQVVEHTEAALIVRKVEEAAQQKKHLLRLRCVP